MSAVFDLARLAASGLVASIDHHESLGSTSDRALELAATDEVKLPLLVLAERQTAGRGRGANRWWSDEGALTFSLALEAPADLLPAAKWPQVALVTGLAVCEALQSLVPTAHFSVKWPNDVYRNGRKVCGILSESVPGWRDRLVVGIGVNVNNRAQTAHLAETAISLIDHDSLPRNLNDVLTAVLDDFDKSWRSLLHGGFAPLAAAFRKRCLLTGKTVTIEQPGGQSVVALCEGIDDFGALRLRTAQGEKCIVSGSVVRWDAGS
jgi:BirA family transcriptional regulator, biotin operon repressor / biotin---[acetyl-CoA-carboxylase] ligase